MKFTPPFDTLLEAFAYFTGCQIATYSQLRSKSRVAKCDLERHKKLCEMMLHECYRQGLCSEELLHLTKEFEEG